MTEFADQPNPFSPENPEASRLQTNLDLLRLDHERLEQDMTPEMPTKIAQNTPEVQELLGDIWGRSARLAIQQNTDVTGKGIYTEIHRYGDALIAIPALASTDYFSSDSGIGYVDVTGGGHTLAEIYAYGGLRSAPGQEEIDKSIFESDIAKLAQVLNMKERGTLLKRCLMRVDQNGQPVINLLEENAYNTTSDGKRLGDPSITEGLSKLGILVASASSSPSSQQHEAAPIAEQLPSSVELSVKEYGIVRESSSTDYLMVLSDASFDEGYLPKLEFAAGTAGLHTELQEVAGLSESTGWVETTIGGDLYPMRIFFSGMTRKAEAPARILWQILGSPTELDRALPEFAQIVWEVGRKLVGQAGYEGSKKIQSTVEVVNPQDYSQREKWGIDDEHIETRH